jgi:hypothetical protein
LSELNTLIQSVKDSFRLVNCATEELKVLKEELNSADTEKECINCRENFFPKENTDTSCVYHPGKVKFYSCK